MDVSGVNPEASVKIQASSSKQLETVSKIILDGVEESGNQTRDFHNTGHNLNLVA